MFYVDQGLIGTRARYYTGDHKIEGIIIAVFQSVDLLYASLMIPGLDGAGKGIKTLRLDSLILLDD